MVGLLNRLVLFACVFAWTCSWGVTDNSKLYTQVTFFNGAALTYDTASDSYSLFTLSDKKINPIDNDCAQSLLNAPDERRVSSAPMPVLVIWDELGLETIKHTTKKLYQSLFNAFSPIPLRTSISKLAIALKSEHGQMLTEYLKATFTRPLSMQNLALLIRAEEQSHAYPSVNELLKYFIKKQDLLNKIYQSLEKIPSTYFQKSDQTNLRTNKESFMVLLEETNAFYLLATTPKEQRADLVQRLLTEHEQKWATFPKYKIIFNLFLDILDNNT